MEVDEVVSGLQQLARGATDFSKSSPTDPTSKDKVENTPGNEGASDCSFPNNLLDAVASSTAMEVEPAVVESSSDSSSSDSSDSSDSDDTSGIIQ